MNINYYLSPEDPLRRELEALGITNDPGSDYVLIKRIESSLLQKFILHLSDGSKVDVTRTYYYIFKDRLGI